jgi:hypothetical protein
LVATLTFAVLTSWLTAYALPTPLNTKAFKWLSIKSREKGFLRVGIGKEYINKKIEELNK